MNHDRAVCMLAAATLASLLAASCSSDDGDGGGTLTPRGTAQKGEACTENVNCAEATAICVNELDKCSGPIGASAFTTECVSGGAEMCAGLRCLVLKANVQNKSGICSMRCTIDADCGGAPTGVCVTLPVGQTCLRPCGSNTDCFHGFVCVPDPVDTSRKACLVESQ